MKKMDYWGEIPLEEMQLLIKFTKKSGWKKGLAEFLKKHPERKDILNTVISGKMRNKWQKFVSIGKNTKVLDVGCGMGTLSYELAKLTDKLYSVDPVPSRVEYTKLRLKSDKLKVHARVQGINDLKKKNFFDVVILMGVLEWVAYMEKSNNPMETQMETLKNLNSILTYNGLLVLGIENRFSWEYFLGRVNHFDIPFSSILPRWLANLIYRLKRSSKYLTITYSYRELKQVLKTAGFNEVTIRVAHPMYQDPKLLFDPDSQKEISNAMKELKNRKFRNGIIFFLNKIGLTKCFASHFIVIARK